MAGAVIACTSCASVTATESPVVQSRVSEECSSGSIIEWDGTPGAATRTGAIEDEIAFLTETLAALPPGAGRSEANDMLQDPVRLRVAIRGLEALVVEVDEAEAELAPEEPLGMSLENESGQVTATAIVAHQLSGGYRLDQFGATAWTTDDPSCE